MRGYLFLLYTRLLEGRLDIQFTCVYKKCFKYIFGMSWLVMQERLGGKMKLVKRL